MGFGILELFWIFIILIQAPGNVLEFSHYARCFKFWNSIYYIFTHILKISVTLCPHMDHLVKLYHSQGGRVN